MVQLATPRSTDWSNTNRTADNVEGVISRDRFPPGVAHAITSISASFDSTDDEVLELFGLSKVGEMDLTDTDVLNLATEAFTVVAHGLAEAQKLVFHTNGGTAPTGLASGTTYFAKGITADTFQLAATSGGAAIALSGTQSAFATEAVVLPLSKSWQVYNHVELDFSTPLLGATGAPLLLKIPAIASVQNMINVDGFSQ